jgi:hypothetical protein
MLRSSPGRFRRWHCRSASLALLVEGSIQWVVDECGACERCDWNASCGCGRSGCVRVENLDCVGSNMTRNDTRARTKDSANFHLVVCERNSST